MSRKSSQSRTIHQNATPALKDLSNKFSKIQINPKNNSRRSSSKRFSVDDLIESIKDGRYKRIVVLAGAGISTPSGIPDFRTPGTGLYDNLQRYNIPYPEAIFEIGYFSRNPQPFFHLAKELYPGRYFPNIIHYFIRYLHDRNLLHRVYTQNIDGLERMAGIPPEKLVEAHGTFATATCQRCHQKYQCEEIRPQIFDNQIPKCTKTKRCTGVVKPDIVFFGEDLPGRFQLYSHDLPMCDCCIVMGTSLAVYPFADIVDSTSRSTARILINRHTVGPFLSPRPYDVTMIGDLEINIKEFLTKLDAIDKVMELMKKENGENEKQHRLLNRNRISSSKTTVSMTSDRLRAAETFIEQRRKFSTFNQSRQESQPAAQQKNVFNEATKLMIEKHNDALLFHRRRSKSAAPVIPVKQESSSSSESSSESLNSSISETELAVFSFKRPTNLPVQAKRKILKSPTIKVKHNSLLNATFRNNS